MVIKDPPPPRGVLPQSLIVEIQKYTNCPWWNGQAYVSFFGYETLAFQAGQTVDDLTDMIEWLRDEKDYEKSDRLREIRKRLNDALVLPAPGQHRK